MKGVAFQWPHAAPGACPPCLLGHAVQGLREDALLGVLAACVASMRRCGSHHIPSASDLEEALLPK